MQGSSPCRWQTSHSIRRGAHGASPRFRSISGSGRRGSLHFIKRENSYRRVQTERHVVRTYFPEDSLHDLGPIAAISIEPGMPRINEKDASIGAGGITWLKTGHVGFREAVVIGVNSESDCPSHPPIRMSHQIDDLIFAQKSIRCRKRDCRASAKQEQNGARP